jgi:hypothetical protein
MFEQRDYDNSQAWAYQAQIEQQCYEEECMSNKQPDINVIENVIAAGDLSQLTSEQRVIYYNTLCEKLGLNPLTRPFEYMDLNGKLVFYARKDCTEQLRYIRAISITKLEAKTEEGVHIVVAYATDKDGRSDIGTGAVPLVKEDGEWVDGKFQDRQGKTKKYFKKNGKMVPLTGEDRANAIMKAETKAKRRVTLSICGLGFLDESEIDSIPGAKLFAEPKDIHPEPTIISPAPPKPKAIARDYSLLVDEINAANNEKELREAFGIGWTELKDDKQKQKGLKSEYDRRLKEFQPTKLNGVAGGNHVHAV